ncbi:four helix bundle protein [Almyronema epifaneia]|uniref:Four helix bundle protein n=1 Tax=Almyronema epifaneia S1 TaxID=2991925 RepID=A0ABW6IJI5_9CYAN
MPADFIANHRELLIYQTAFEAAMRLFELSKAFPEDERSLLTRQILRSSRSVCANLAEAWQKRRYRNAFMSKFNEVEAEAAETQTWIEFAILCEYLDPEVGQELFHQYEIVIAVAARFIEHADAWVVK